MRVLAIHEGHNGSVALLENGKIVFALSEERLSRIKNHGGFPRQSILRGLADAGYQPGDLDCVALCGTKPVKPEWSQKELILKRYRKYCEDPPGRSDILRKKVVEALPEPLVDGIRKVVHGRSAAAVAKDGQGDRIRQVTELGIPPEKVKTFDHHLCHAAGAYYASGPAEEPVLCFTCDGGGDSICASVSVGEGGSLRRRMTIPVADSIAKLYGLITYVMGMVPMEHEYKLMGLAPYADAEKAEKVADFLEGLFTWEDGGDRWARKPGLPSTSYWYHVFWDRIRFERFDVIAGGFQKFVERMMVRWIRYWVRKTGIGRVAMSGGIFMNVKMNKLIMELDEVRSIYVLPSCGDESNVFGGSYLGALSVGASAADLSPLGPLYLGPKYSDQEVSSAVEGFAKGEKLRVTAPQFLEKEVARLLFKGKIVARYNGREEFGARALGNRSILADAGNLRVIREINQMIKCRDFWMPFAGTMTEEQARVNLINRKGVDAPYMILTFDTNGRGDDLGAAVHPYDRTMRPQVLKKEWNPSYHAILTEFQNTSGKNCGILNTSFNLHGHPIVSSPADALDVFQRSGLEYLSIGKYLVSKADASQAR